MSSDCPAYTLKNTAMKAFLLAHIQDNKEKGGGGDTTPSPLRQPARKSLRKYVT